MTDLTSLEALARELMVRECCVAKGVPADEGELETICPGLWLIRELVGLVEEFRDRPVAELAPMIRRMMVEQNFVDENGDCVFDVACQCEVDRQVALIVRVLERFRQEAREQGVLCTSTPSCEPWFG